MRPTAKQRRELRNDDDDDTQTSTKTQNQTSNAVTKPEEIGATNPPSAKNASQEKLRGKSADKSQQLVKNQPNANEASRVNQHDDEEDDSESSKRVIGGKSAVLRAEFVLRGEDNDDDDDDNEFKWRGKMKERGKERREKSRNEKDASGLRDHQDDGAQEHDFSQTQNANKVEMDVSGGGNLTTPGVPAGKQGPGKMKPGTGDAMKESGGAVKVCVCVCMCVCVCTQILTKYFLCDVYILRGYEHFVLCNDLVCMCVCVYMCVRKYELNIFCVMCTYCVDMSTLFCVMT
jgi:hypothetical protein